MTSPLGFSLMMEMFLHSLYLQYVNYSAVSPGTAPYTSTALPLPYL